MRLHLRLFPQSHMSGTGWITAVATSVSLVSAAAGNANKMPKNAPTGKAQNFSILCIISAKLNATFDHLSLSI